MPGHVETLRRQHSRSVISGDAISSEGFAVGEVGHQMFSPSLRFGIVEGLGLVLGQDCGRAAQGVWKLTWMRGRHTRRAFCCRERGDNIIESQV